jgi:hypothetical protein
MNQAVADRWFGHSLVAVGGSSFSMPDTPELQARELARKLASVV